MKQTEKRIVALALVLFMFFGCALSTMAAGNVTYDGDSRAFIFAPGTEDAPTNLLPSFSDLMPGDSVTEKIVIKNGTEKNTDVTFYLRALGADAGSEALLTQLQLTVTQGEGTLFEAPAAETAQLTNWVCLGTLKPGGETELLVTVTVPMTLGNEFQMSEGTFSWEFKIEEKDTAPVLPLILYTLRFETNGGNKIPSIIRLYGTTVDLRGYIPIRDGYSFTGWFSDEALTKSVSSVRLTRNMTVYAGWRATGTNIPSNLKGTDHFAYIIGYDDGMVHPEADITRAEVATIFFRLLNDDVRKSYLTKTNSFLDVSTDAWYNTAVSTMEAMGVLKGYEGYYRPDDPITRAEFAAIAARFADAAGDKYVEFMDISGHWAELEILKAASLGWVEGYNGYYRPDDPITRAESMAIINRVLCRIPETTGDLLPDMKVWKDNADTSKWYYIAVQEATNSHAYEYKSGVYEKWTALTENPDWDKYE